MAIRAIRLPKWVSAIRVIGRVATRIYATVHLDAVLAALVNSYCRPGWTALVAQQVLRVVVADRIALAWRKRVAELAEVRCVMSDSGPGLMVILGGFQDTNRYLKTIFSRSIK